MPLAAGTKLDSYEVLGLLEAGGMGEVYRARDSALKRGIAIKVLPSLSHETLPAAALPDRETVTSLKQKERVASAGQYLL
jgi:serine/threonine protein kinase